MKIAQILHLCGIEPACRARKRYASNQEHNANQRLWKGIQEKSVIKDVARATASQKSLRSHRAHVKLKIVRTRGRTYGRWVSRTQPGKVAGPTRYKLSNFPFSIDAIASIR